MKYIYTYFLFFLLCIIIASETVGDMSIANMDELKYKKCVIVELKEISLWAVGSKGKQPLYKERSFSYNPPYEDIAAPSLCFKGQKLLFARNYSIGSKGALILLDINSSKEQQLYEGKNRIIFPTLASNEQEVAFLSDFDSSRKSYSLFRINLASMKVQKVTDDVGTGGSYNLNISWMPDNKRIAYADTKGNIYAFDVVTGEKQFIIAGYDPLISPDGNKLLFKQSIYKPYNPFIYNMIDGKRTEIKLSDINNATWAPDSKSLLIVKNDWNLFSWSEWRKKVIEVDLDTKKEHTLFYYKGFEYLDCR